MRLPLLAVAAVLATTACAAPATEPTAAPPAAGSTATSSEGSQPQAPAAASSAGEAVQTPSPTRPDADRAAAGPPPAVAPAAPSTQRPATAAPDLTTSAPAGPDLAPPVVSAAAPTTTAVPGAFVVVLEDGVAPAAVRGVLGTAPTRTYTSALNGFAVRLDPAALARVRSHPGVASVEPDQVVRTAATQVTPAALYGLDRLDQRTQPLNGRYAYTRTGRGVTAYVIDTGIAGHPDFGTRASNVFDAFGGRGTDCNGHGTHVAGTVGSRTYGVAKEVALRGVRVLDCEGAGTTSSVLAGVDHVAATRRLPAVATLSLGGLISPALDLAVSRLVDRGVAVAVAAGNESIDACLVSPARARGVVTVAASDRLDVHALFSNHGPCVELYAPGVDIRSTSLRHGTAVLSGTSMATPHVAGVLALRLQGGRTTGAAAVAGLLSSATTGQVRLEPPTTPDRLLYKGGL